MNILPFDKQVAVVACLCEGMSIRSVERLLHIHRDTVMRLGVRAGAGCAKLHDHLVRGVRSSQIELDEIWSYIGRKQKRVKPTDSAELGDCYTFIAMDAISKLIISHFTGKRDGTTARALVVDLRERVLGVPTVSSDAFPAYADVVASVFGPYVHYGQIVKNYAAEPPVPAARRYSPGSVVSVVTNAIIGTPLRICTSHIERQNLSVRMASRRFTRLTNAYSKKVANHAAAVGLYAAHYNLVRVHETLRTTPAVAAGVADHVWSVAELVENAIANGQDKTVSRFRLGADRLRHVDVIP